MHISALALTPLISLIAGVLILVMPRLLNYIVALYLIVAGLLGLFPHLAGARYPGTSDESPPRAGPAFNFPLRLLSPAMRQ